jgi:hypothetical protein
MSLPEDVHAIWHKGSNPFKKTKPAISPVCFFSAAAMVFLFFLSSQQRGERLI